MNKDTPQIDAPSAEEMKETKEINEREEITNELRHLGQTHQEDVALHADPKAVRRLTWKMDALFIPLTFIVYTFCFIDRSSVGNAGIAGFKQDLGLVGQQYNLGVSLFFIAYVAFQAPSNIMLKIVGAKYWVSFLILSFGSITLATSWIRSAGSFYTVRFLLGMVEGGVLSGMAFMLSNFYPREQMTLRIGVYMLCASSSGAFGGILAYGLIQIGPHGDLKSWSYIFLVEGAISMFLSICVLVLLPSSIESAWFLNAEEKKLARARMAASNRLHENAKVEKTQWHLIFRALRNPLNLICGFTYFGVSFIVQSLAIFTPTILTGLGYGVEGAQLASVWPSLLGFFTNLAILIASNLTNLRAPYILCSAMFCMVGFGMLLSTDHHVQYGGLFMANLSSSVSGPLLIGWAGGNQAPLTCRAIAIAMAPSIGHIGAICASWSYRQQDAPRYLLGNGLNFAMAGWSTLLCGAGILYVKWENSARAAGKRDYRLSGDPVVDGELGSDHPSYRLIY